MIKANELPKMPFRIFEHLATDPNAEDFWKLVFYQDVDAVQKPALTYDQKINLIWTDGKPENSNIFFARLVEDALPESKTIVKCYDFMIQPHNRSVASVVWCFEILYGGEQSIAYSADGIPCNRGDLILNQLMRSLNGAHVGGVGELAFDDEINRYVGAKSTFGNGKSFTGIILYLATMLGSGYECTCG